jgi:hypothetical protein
MWVNSIFLKQIMPSYRLCPRRRRKVITLIWKFLLGIKVSENVKGTIIYKRAERLTMQYAATRNWKLLYLNRPLKLIELTSGEKMYWHLILK